MKKSYEHTRVIKHLSLSLEREKHLIEWFERNKGQASILIKQWIEKNVKYSYNVYSQTKKAFCDDALNLVEQFDNPDDAMNLADELNRSRIDDDSYRDVSYYVIVERAE